MVTAAGLCIKWSFRPNSICCSSWESGNSRTNAQRDVSDPSRRIGTRRRSKTNRLSYPSSRTKPMKRLSLRRFPLIGVSHSEAPLDGQSISRKQKARETLQVKNGANFRGWGGWEGEEATSLPFSNLFWLTLSHSFTLWNIYIYIYIYWRQIFFTVESFLLWRLKMRNHTKPSSSPTPRNTLFSPKLGYMLYFLTLWQKYIIFASFVHCSAQTYAALLPPTATDWLLEEKLWHHITNCIAAHWQNLFRVDHLTCPWSYSVLGHPSSHRNHNHNHPLLPSDDMRT